jgi:type IV secretory pathway VirB10-like protein
MASAASIFFAGVGTSVVLIGVGFGSGVLLGKAAVDLPQNSRTVASQDSVPSPARVILPTTTAATLPADQLVEPAAEPAKPEPALKPIPVKDVQKQDSDREKQAARQAEKEKQQAAKKAAARERQKRYAAQKARQEAARRQQPQQEQQPEPLRQSEQPSLLGFARNEGEAQQASFFGN